MDTDAVRESSASDTKVCYICGLDLSGKPRRKDERGRYWCVPCSRGMDDVAIAERRQPGKSQCQDCGKQFPTSVMLKVDDAPICEPCNNVRLEEKKKALARREQTARGGEEERKSFSRLLILIIIAVLLAVFTVYWNFFAQH